MLSTSRSAGMACATGDTPPIARAVKTVSQSAALIATGSKDRQLAASRLASGRTCSEGRAAGSGRARAGIRARGLALRPSLPPDLVPGDGTGADPLLHGRSFAMSRFVVL